MELTKLEDQARRDFNNAICLIGIIPFLAFVYLLVVKIGSINILVGDIGYFMLVTMGILLLGIILGRKLIWSLIMRIIESSQQIIKMQEELVEKKRLAAITETTLSLSHEINNPLLVIRGNLEILESEAVDNNLPDYIKQRLSVMKSNFDRIGQVTDKMAQLSNPVTTTVHDGLKMIDLPKSK